MAERVTVVLVHHVRQCRFDVDIPLDISASDLIYALNEGYQLGINTKDSSACFLRAESPVALLRGNKRLEDYGVRNGTIIHITE